MSVTLPFVNSRKCIWLISLCVSVATLSLPSVVSASSPVDVIAVSGNNSARLSWNLSTDFPISFNGASYNEVFIGSNSYLTFGAGSTAYSGLGQSNPSSPGVHVCASDWSYGLVQYKLDTGVTPNQLRIRFQGNASRTSTSTPNIIYEAVFYRGQSYFDLLIGNHAGCSYTSSKLLTNGSTSSSQVSFAANTNWRISGLTATQNGQSATWDGSTNSSVNANTNGWTALTSGSSDDAFVSSRIQPSYYLVQASSDGGVTWGGSVATNSTANSFTYTSLTNGISYVFRVAAYIASSNTTGSWSAASAPVVPNMVPPGQPTSLSGVSGNGRASLTWAAPNSVGDSAIVGYKVDYSTNGGLSWATASSNTFSSTTTATVTGLTNGLSYIFRVAAINSSSTGAWSNVSAPVIPIVAVPGQPTSLVATRGDESVSLSWTAPSSVGDSAIVGYRIDYSSNGGVSWSTATSNTYSSSTNRVVTWLTNGSTYIFRVAAINSSGSGAWSVSSLPATPRDPDMPLAPTSVWATPGDGQAVLYWTPVSTSYLSGYRIEYSTNGGSTWWIVNSNTYSSTTNRTITGLVNGVSYKFRIAAVNYYGRGDYASVDVTAVKKTTASTSSKGSSKKVVVPATKYVSRTFTSSAPRISLKSVLSSAKISLSGSKSISGSVVSFMGAPCRVSGSQLLRDDKESSCVVRITMKKADKSTVIATVTVLGTARASG